LKLPILDNLLQLCFQPPSMAVSITLTTLYYVCGEYTPLAHRVKLHSRIRNAYEHCFSCQVGDQNKKWAPHICCNQRPNQLFSSGEGTSVTKFHSMTSSCLFNRGTTFLQTVTDKVIFATFPKMRTFRF